MGTMILIIFILVLVLCFCVYNSWFQREKNKRMFDHEKKNVSTLNNYIAWAVYSIVVFLAIITIIGYELYVLMNNIYKM